MLLSRWAYNIGLGVNENVHNTGEPMPNFFLGVDFIVFSSIFFLNYKPPPPPPSQGFCCFFLNIRLSQTCIATAVPPHGNLTKAPRGRKTRRCKIIAMNKAFESQGSTLVFSPYVGLGPASTVHPKINIRNFKHPKKLFEILATQNISPILYLDLKKRP